ncbi:MAG: hypothetical protein ACE5H4_11125 [Candidatus Thorarchaeota archaeon]
MVEPEEGAPEDSGEEVEGTGRERSKDPADEAAMEDFVKEVEQAISESKLSETNETADAEGAPGEGLSTMMSEAFKKLDEIEESLTRSVPITKEDWIQALPTHVRDHFFEEELRQLSVEDLEDLSGLTPEQLEELIASMSARAGTDRIVIDDSSKTIPGALKEVPRPTTKKELIRALPVYIREAFRYKRLEAMSEVDLEELANLSPEKFQKLFKILRKHKDWKDM